MPPSWLSVIRDAILVTALSAGLALAYNALRPAGKIPLVADKPYEILVPCPEHVGKPARALGPDGLRVEEQGLALIDARDKESYDEWHLPGAISIPFDYLEPKPEEKKVLRTHARKVVVYGDGENPDSGEQLAHAISGKGVKNVFFVKGGAPALRRKR
jgi:rhodanese-related sulfurtransferase